MTEFLIRYFVKDYEDVEKVSVRTAYGMLSGIVGIFCNVILFLTKLIVGLVLNSVSVMADAFNNLSDAGSSVISFVGVRMAGKPADKDHPFGHGRIEYIAALIVSFLVLEVGFTFLKDSVGKILHPEQLKFLPVSVLILCLSIAVKLWLGLFNIFRKIRRCNSPGDEGGLCRLHGRRDHDFSDNLFDSLFCGNRDQYGWICRSWRGTGCDVGRFRDCKRYIEYSDW